MRTIRYLDIADSLRERITADEFGPGGLLPSEAALCATHAASRVTIRRALETLRDEGLVDSRQGFGWVVSADPVRQGLASLGTIEAQLRDSGRVAARDIVGFRFIDAPSAVAPVLGARVLEVRRRNLADGVPFARVTVWCREDLGAELSKADVTRHSFYELLRLPLGGATQTIGAALMGADDAELLDVPIGSAALVAQRTTSDTAGRPVLVAEHVFPGHLTEFVVELGVGTVAEDAPGLRLVE